MRFETIELAGTAPLAEIRLSRPSRGNPVDAAFLAELDAAALVIRDNAAIRAVLLTAAGDDFSAPGAGDPSPCRPSATLPFHTLEQLPQPVITCIQGRAMGGGLELALACDIRVADTTATFRLPQVSNGSIPSLGGTQRLPRLIGRARAAEMIFLGTKLDAPAAAACGLVNNVVAPGELRVAAEALAARIIERGPLAVGYAKEAILRGLDMPLSQALRYETDLTVILQTTADRAEGVAAFIEKRQPRFEGR